MTQIKFGTDGWRDIIADKFTFANVKIVVQGIAAYVKNHNLDKRGIVLGYDNRFLSPEFAEAACCVLAGNGIRVFLPEKSLPTPVVAYAVRALNAGGAIMFTASHNPADYNGLKFIPEYAGPALPDITDEIEIEVNRVIEGAKVYELSMAEANKLGLIEGLDINSKYLEHLKRIIDFKVFERNKLKIVVDPMFGAGIGYLEPVLAEAGCEILPIHDYRDPLFGGSMPEPTDHILTDLKARVVTEGAALGLALDGDADRFGIVSDTGEFIPPNKVLYLVLQHILATRSFRGPVARTLATTHMLDRVAAASGLTVIETPVGFKYIGQCLREKGCMLGGEESGGLTILGHVPEKDGILACLLVAEMVAARGGSLQQIYDEFVKEFGQVESERLDVKYDAKEREAVMARLKDYKPKQVAGIRVQNVGEMEGKKLTLEDNSWLLIRASGTEPLLRVYVEASDKLAIKSIQDDVRQALGI
ncbi:MAG: phosphoglucomutase/phosphomannomutase family protein [Candidatus Saccharibacteria bacterium]